MKGLTSTSWAGMQASLWPSQAAATPKTMGHSRKAWKRHVEVLKPLRRLALIIFPSLAMAAPASAVQDDNAYPGALCQSARNTDSILRDDDGFMFNTGSGPQQWICPLVKEITPSFDPEFAQIVAFERAGPPFDPVECSIQSRAARGGNDQEATDASPERVGNLRIFTFGDDRPNVLVGVQGGFYYFICLVPGTTDPRNPEGGIISYALTENDGED